MNIKNELNPEQGKAATTINGPVLVLAGAGTGKTRVITFRIAYMLDQGILPEHILGLTFTNKAAKEMKERLAQLVNAEAARQVTLGTFHSFCIKILRKEIRALNYTTSFTVADDTDQRGLVKQAMAELGFNSEMIDPKSISSYISDLKNRLITPEHAARIADGVVDARKAAVYRGYQELLENQNMIDFDDMLMFVVKIFDENPDVLKRYRTTYQYVMVDEYQDTNDAQFKLLKMLVEKHQNLCVVGDDDQSIYGWRGANISNILDFPQMFNHTTEIRLEQNYRSTNNILASANAVISGNSNRFDKKLWSDRGDGEKVKLIKNSNADSEAQFIADYIEELKANNSRLKYSDFALLYRSNHLSRVLENVLRRSSIPYRLVGGQEFFKRKEVKDAVAYLKLIVNPKEDQSLLRILGTPPRGLGNKAVNRLKELQHVAFMPFSELMADGAFLDSMSTAARKSASEFSACLKKHQNIFREPGMLTQKVRNYLDEIGYLHGLQRIYKDIKDAQKRQDNVLEFMSAILDFERNADQPPTLAEYLESYALLEENDRTDDEEDNNNSVTLSTIHASKGLEYPVVFLPAMEKNIFPHERSEMEKRLEEELRLFYVAITRAKDHLIISYSSERTQRGRSSRQRPSPFLENLPEELCDSCNPDELIKPMDEMAMRDGISQIIAMLNND
jgi:superfamily I DNA/RNA helicase